MMTRDSKPGMTTEPGCQTREDDAQDRGGDDADQDRLVALLTDSLELRLSHPAVSLFQGFLY